MKIGQGLLNGDEAFMRDELSPASSEYGSECRTSRWIELATGAGAPESAGRFIGVPGGSPSMQQHEARRIASPQDFAGAGAALAGSWQDGTVGSSVAAGVLPIGQSLAKAGCMADRMSATHAASGHARCARRERTLFDGRWFTDISLSPER